VFPARATAALQPFRRSRASAEPAVNLQRRSTGSRAASRGRRKRRGA
jgi:hypothetical protein